MSDHERFRFSVSCRTDDAAVLHCLRGLCHFAERDQRKNIAWGHTGEREWELNGGIVTFHFTGQDYRETFIREGSRLLPGLWKEVGRSNNDPASPK